MNAETKVEATFSRHWLKVHQRSILVKPGLCQHKGRKKSEMIKLPMYLTEQ